MVMETKNAIPSFALSPNTAYKFGAIALTLWNIAPFSRNVVYA